MTGIKPSEPARISAEDALSAVDQVIISIVQGSRVDLARLRALPKWRAVMYARLAYKAGTLPRAELDQIVREASFAGVRPAKTPVSLPPFIARNIANQLGDLWDVPVDVRQATNDTAAQFVAGLIAERTPNEDEISRAISDPGRVVPRAADESVPRWGARAVLRILHTKLLR